MLKIEKKNAHVEETDETLSPPNLTWTDCARGVSERKVSTTVIGPVVYVTGSKMGPS